MITLDALQAQTVAYVSANYEPDDEYGRVVVDACRVILGEPGNYSDPRRFLVYVAAEELTNIWKAVADDAEGDRVRLRDFGDMFGDQGYAAGMALEILYNEKMMEHADAPEDKQWHAVVGYLENIRDGASEVWVDLDRAVDLDGIEDILGD